MKVTGPGHVGRLAGFDQVWELVKRRCRLARFGRLYFITVAGLSEFTVTWLALKSRGILPVEFDFASG